jgi:tubulin--tyrosine ligase
VQQKIRKIATDIIRGASLTIDPKRRLNNFEVFGMDFMVDSAFRPWLIEVNTNPCLELASPLLAKLIPAMVDNALRIAVDPLYPTPIGSNRKVYPEQNRFSLVYDELIDGPEL